MNLSYYWNTIQQLSIINSLYHLVSKYGFNICIVGMSPLEALTLCQTINSIPLVYWIVIKLQYWESCVSGGPFEGY